MTGTIDDMTTEEAIKKGLCTKGLHFPERIYYWELLNDYYGHCAICGTEYRITRKTL